MQLQKLSQSLKQSFSKGLTKTIAQTRDLGNRARQQIGQVSQGRSIPYNMQIMVMSFLPLMLGLAITISLSIIVLVILAPYWTKTAGQEQVQFQFKHLSAHSKILCNQQTSLYDSIVLPLIQVSPFITKQGVQIFDDSKFISMFQLSQGQIISTNINGWNSSNNLSYNQAGWAQRDSSIQQNNQISDQDKLFLSRFQSAFLICQAILLAQKQILNSFFFMTPNGLFLQYPLMMPSINTTLNLSQIYSYDQMYNGYNGASKQVRWIIQLSFYTQICDAMEITQKDGTTQFVGFNCVLAYTTLFNNVFSNAVDTIRMPEYSWYAINTLNDDFGVLMKSNNFLYQDALVQSFFTIQFNVSNQNISLNQLARTFNTQFSQQIQWSNQSNIELLLGTYSNSTDSNQFALNQIFLPFINSQEIRSSFTLIFEDPTSSFEISYKKMGSMIIHDSETYIITFGILTMVLGFGFSLCLSQKQANLLVSTLDDLLLKVRQIEKNKNQIDLGEDNERVSQFQRKSVLFIDKKKNQDQTKIDTITVELYNNDFKETCFELNSLYEKFDKFKKVLNFGSDDYFLGDDSEQLIKYSSALILFQSLENNKGQGIVLNNMGNIHIRNDRFYIQQPYRYDEAIHCYTQAIEKSMNELQLIIEGENLEEVYQVNDIDDQISDDRQELVNKSRHIYINTKRKRPLDEVISNRTYQLANAKMIKAAAYQDDSFPTWNNIYHLLLRVNKITASLKQNKAREITCKLLLVDALCKLDRVADSASLLDEVGGTLDEYAKLYILFLEEKKQSEPPDILHQRYLYCRGIFFKNVGDPEKAAAQFTLGLKRGSVYDPDIRTKCLEQLILIFEKQNQIMRPPFIYPNIWKLYQQNKRNLNKDMIFCLDFSEGMNHSSKKNDAIRTFLKVFDNYLENEDRLAFITFNDNVEVKFELTMLGLNKVFLRNSIQNLQDKKKVPQGGAALYNALNEACALYQKALSRENSTKWIVAFIGSEDTSSQIRSEKLIQRLKNFGISLVIIGIAVDEESKKDLKFLCRQTVEGAFIEIEKVETNDLDITFQALTNLLFRDKTQKFIVETFN